MKKDRDKNREREIMAGLAEFLRKSPTAFHAVAAMREILDDAGYQALPEGEAWKLEPGGRYYVTRSQSSLIALKLGEELERYSFHVAAAHGDSPTFKVKENAEIAVKERYLQLNTEGYGGVLCAPWFDRPLSVAGRAVVREGDRLVTRLVKVDRDLVLIPSLAIHMDRGVNDGRALNLQVDMLPLFGGGDCRKGDLRRLIARELGVAEQDICGMDLYLYNRMEPTVWGADGEFFSGPRLDDLQCAYGALQGFLRGSHPRTVGVYACFDNEEVGSGTKQGAGSTFLYDVLHRVNQALGKGEEAYHRALASSFLLSCDNAHAVHPNHPEKTDVENCVYMNEGVVVKSHAGQKYTSDAVSIAVFRRICEKAGVPLQYFSNRSDAKGGGTLGNIAMAQVSMNAVDIGLPQLAMHSPYETSGVRDSAYLIRAAEAFYSSHLDADGDALSLDILHIQ